MKAVWLTLASLAILSGGCATATFKNPLFPGGDELPEATVALDNYNSALENMNERVMRREVTPEQRDKYLQEWMKKVAQPIDLRVVPVDKAFQYGDILRLAGEWERARTVYKMAAEHAERTKNMDRFVNDRLKEAWCNAELGKLDEAITLCRSTFGAPAAGKAPILYSVLYEVIPAAKGKGKDLELGDLLMDAVDQYNHVEVDPDSDAGKSFILARVHHLRRARTQAISLYQDAGDSDKATKALETINSVLNSERFF